MQRTNVQYELRLIEMNMVLGYDVTSSYNTDMLVTTEVNKRFLRFCGSVESPSVRPIVTLCIAPLRVGVGV